MRANVLFATALVVLVAACGREDEEVQTTGEELEVPVHEEWEAGMAALVRGTVQFELGCVFLVGDGYRTLVVWPPDTTATRDPFAVVLADGREIHEGDHVEGSGGGYASEPEPPERCTVAAEGVNAFNWHDDLVISARP